MDRKTDFLFHIIFNMCLPILFAIIVHYILEKAFIKDKGTIKLKLESSSKGRFYFIIDFAFFIFLFYKDKRNSLQESGTHRQGMQKAPTLTAEIH